MSIRPAEIAGLADRHGRPVQPGEPANLAVFDPDAEWTVNRTDLASLALNTPFHGRTVRGRIKHTVFGGELVVTDGKATPMTSSSESTGVSASFGPPGGGAGTG